MQSYSADWRIAENYPPIYTEKNVGSEMYFRLAWEFLRRNKEYAIQVTQLLALPASAREKGKIGDGKWCLDTTICNPPALPKETSGDYKKRMKNDGVVGWKIHKPIKFFKRRWCLEGPVEPNVEYEQGEVVFSTSIQFKRGKKDGRIKEYLLPNEFVIKFNAEFPVDLQLEMARNKLLEFIKEKRSGPEGASTASHFSRIQQDIYKRAPFSLRCYDALVSGMVTAKEVKEVLGQEFFKKNKLLKNKRQKSKKGTSKKVKESFDVQSYRRTADQFINNKKYLRLIFQAVEHPNNVQDFINAMVKGKT